jgi:pyruvate formate lyase activating enzyme
MKIGGLQKVSLIDYPGAICAIIFSQGCNFKCGYCHNPELVDPERFGKCIDEKKVMEFLATRKGKLDAVSVTGGEPTIQKDLIEFVKKIKKMGFAVKIDTNGSQPHVLKALLKDKLLDFIAMDIKAPWEKYEKITGVSADTRSIQESISLVLQSKIPHEFRTTVVEPRLNTNDIMEISKSISGAQSYVLQKFIPTKALDKKYLKEKTLSDEELEQLKKRIEKDIPCVIVR